MSLYWSFLKKISKLLKTKKGIFKIFASLVYYAIYVLLIILSTPDLQS